MKQFVRAIVGVPLALLVSTPRAALAGDGKITGSKLSITVYFDYDETDFSGWEPVFTEFSKLLYNGTEKQLQLGQVMFTTCPEFKKRADVWVKSGSEGAVANRNGLGVLGAHITISQKHKSTTGSARGQFGLTHEAGHYLWGLFDEYKGFVGESAAQDPLHFCVTDVSAIASIMDGGTEIPTNNQRHEYCTKASLNLATTRHNQGQNNAAGQPVKTLQEKKLGQSCWERMVATGVGGLIAPASDPVDDVTGHQAVLFESTSGQPAIVLVIDRSGSMASENRMALAKEGAKLGVGLAKDDQKLAVVSFDSSVALNVPIGVVTTAFRTAANSAIDAIQPGGATAIGEGLAAAQGQLASANGCAEAVILLSDGVSNSGRDPLVAAAALAAAKITVHTIALGAGADSSTMARIASSTGGKFFAAQTSAQLPAILAEIMTEATGATVGGASSEDSLSAGTSESHSVTIPPGSGELAVSLGRNPADPLMLTLFEPDGTPIPQSTTRLDVTVFSAGSQVVMRVADPAPGLWSVQVIAGGIGPVAFPYNLLMGVASAGLDVNIQFDANEVTFPGSVVIHALVTSGFPVVGAEVSGRIRLPNGTVRPEPLTLFDDGLVVHGDEAENDGVYSQRFDAFTTSGNYTFTLDVINNSGTSSTSSECPPAATLREDGTQAVPVAPFTARVSGSAVVGNVPFLDLGGLTLSNQSATIDGQTISASELSLTPVLSFDLNASADEAVNVTSIQLNALDTLGSAPATLPFFLFLDADQDGEVDSPPTPIETGSFAAGVLRASGSAGPLLIVPAGATSRIIVAAGLEKIPQPIAMTMWLPPFPRFMKSNLGLKAIWVASVLALAAAYSWRGSIRPRWRALGAAASLAFACVLFVAQGCGGGGSGGGGSTSSFPATFTISLAAGDIQAEGARTGQPVPVLGSDASSTTTITP